MTIRFTLTLTTEGGAHGAAAHPVTVSLDRAALSPETLGLTLSEGKTILAELQAAIVAEQVAAHERAARPCPACGILRSVKGHHPLTCRSAFGTLPLTVRRLRRCACGSDAAAGERASFSPVADLLPERTTPEMLYLETRWGSLVSFGLAARMLSDVLPLDRPVAPERVRRHLHAVMAREEAAMGEEPHGWAWSGCQRDLNEMPLPNGPAYVGVDGGFVRDRAGSWFEVIAGKSISGFDRHAPEATPSPPAKCFAFVQTHDDRPRRRLLDVLTAQGYAANQKLVLMSDGGDSVRRLVSCISSESEHVLDWFHVTMRLTVLGQMIKGACPADPSWTEERLRDLDRLKWLLWHGHARQAVDAAQWIADEAWAIEDDAKSDTKAKLKRLRTAAEEVVTYLERNAAQIVDYGERHRAGERISTGFVESTVNQVIAKRFCKRQSMRWTPAGAHLTLQARTRALNGDLADCFRRQWPGFQLPCPEPQEEMGSFACPQPASPPNPIAHIL